MTNNEAIKVLLNEWKCIDRNDGVNCNRKCESCDLVMDTAVLKDAYNLAIDALKKQIPQKPKKIDHWRLCPTCHEKNGFSYDYLVGMKQRGHGDISYCLGCGQAVDWKGESWQQK